jgi:hypothetical protein
MDPVLRISRAMVVGPHRLHLVFSTGEAGEVDVKPLIESLQGPVFSPLQDPAYFARVVVDPLCGTVVWPNGADLSPDALRERLEIPA